VAAVKAFNQFAPVFKEPRCINCHGGVNPYIADGDHAGGLIDVLGITDNDKIRQSEPAVAAMHKTCSQSKCHIDGWFIPMKANHFVNKTEQELCLQMKRRNDNAQGFLRHVRIDSDIKIGFAGTRGLREPDPPTEKPTMTYAQLLRSAEAWVRAMGGKFHRPEDCGCVIHGLVLRIQHRIDTDPTDVGFRGGETKYSGVVDFVVRLEPRPDIPEGWLTGETSVIRPISVHHVRPDCSGKSAPREEDWDFRLIPDESGKLMKFLFSIGADDPVTTLTCTRGMTTIQEGNAAIFSELSHRLDMTIPTTNGNTTKFQSKAFDSREWLTVTVVNNPETN
jgi:hypothetical protein